ncbi:MAG: hypothetical protein COU40_02335 [Candidatus Moranbacteria bacterium CG10_big_fil_rev_8_21_14_0_10_35_21]|nr:MAG: hypothetical protein COU40_02335 [Candidatus Moranbacteria bacterium CG10_big_fil_rev_8_21_14_0_10_35_21]PJA88924.1 MAG: hypothetical protein CO139_00500 [Candidatus Moranbacteria bacterium CG_4_9_14_3_um_filter_36_9]
MSKRKKYTIWVIIIAVVIGGGYFYKKSQKPKVEYTTEVASRGGLAQTVSVTGEATQENQINLSLKNTGRLRTLNVDVGDKVKKGEQLAVIDEGTLLSNLSTARAEADYQKKTYFNIKDKSAYTKNQKLAQKSKVASAEASVEAVIDQLRETTLESPIDGVVIKKLVNQGEMAIASATILTVAEEGDLIIQSNVPESDIVEIKIGQKADVTFDAIGSKEIFEAEVYEIDPASTVIQDVVYYRIKLKLSTQDERLKPGMSCDLDVKISDRSEALMIPLRAVKDGNGEKYVEVLKNEKTSEVEKVKVETGLEGDEGMVEILSGLQGGEKVVTLTK